MASGNDGTTTGGTAQPEPEQAEFDWLTNMPLLHINFILNKFIWKDYPNSNEVMFSWDNIQEGINKVAENYPEFSVVYHGEYGSRMCIPPKVIVQRSPEAASETTHRDKNIIWVKDETESIVSDPNKLVVKPDASSPGYVQLQVVQDGPESKPEVITYGQLKNIYTKLDKMSQDINSSLVKERLESICSLVVPVESWPEDESKWLERAKTHNWPDPELISGIMLAGCHVTPKISPNDTFGSSPDDPVIWRYCFPSAEMILQPMMKDTMKKILALFYLLLDDDLLLSSVITKEQVRMELYATVQKLGEERFEEENLGWCFLALCDTIFHDLILGQMPNYFFPEHNMVQGAEDDFMTEARRQVSRIRRMPCDFLFKFEANKRLTCMPEVLIKKITEPIFQNQTSIEMPKVLASIYMSLNTEIALRLKNNDYNTAKECAEEAASIYTKIRGETIQATRLLADIAYGLEDTRQAVFAMEKAYEDAPDAAQKAAQAGNLGCMYYGLACQTEDQEEKTRLLQKTEAMFRPRLSDMDCAAATKLDYYNIIVSQGRYTEAIPLLKKFVQEHRGDGSGNQFDKHEKLSLDEGLQVYIDSGENVSVHSVNYGYFLLAKCYSKVGGSEMEESFWDAYSATCQEAAQTKEERITFSLLGLSYESIGEMERAQIAFHQALAINEKDIVAKLHVASNIPENLKEKKTDHSADGATGGEKMKGAEEGKMEVAMDEAGDNMENETGEEKEGKIDDACNKVEGKTDEQMEVKTEDTVKDETVEEKEAKKGETNERDKLGESDGKEEKTNS